MSYSQSLLAIATLAFSLVAFAGDLTTLHSPPVHAQREETISGGRLIADNSVGYVPDKSYTGTRNITVTLLQDARSAIVSAWCVDGGSVTLLSPPSKFYSDASEPNASTKKTPICASTLVDKREQYYKEDTSHFTIYIAKNTDNVLYLVQHGPAYIFVTQYN